MKKRTLPTMVAAAIMTLAPLHSQASSANGTETVTYLVLTQTDGTINKFSLNEAPVLSYAGDSLVVTCGSDQLMTALEGLRDYSFTTEQVTTSIKDVPATGSTSTTPASNVAFSNATISGLKAGALVRVYNISGVAVSTLTADAEGKVSVDLNNLPKGVYILSTPSKSFKVLNK